VASYCLTIRDVSSESKKGLSKKDEKKAETSK